MVLSTYVYQLGGEKGREGGRERKRDSNLRVHTVHVNEYFTCTCTYFSETLLGQLSSYIKQLREDFTTHYIGSPAHQSQHQLRNYQDQGAPPTGKNLPEVVNNIAWARQLEAKVLL